MQVTPSVAPEGFRDGQLGCVRGQSNPQRLYSTRRVLHPMRQTGERGSDNWEQISWDEATDLIAEKFRAALDEYGGKSIAVWHSFGSGGYFVRMYPSYPNGFAKRAYRGVSMGRFIDKVGATVFGPSSDTCGLYMQTTVLAIPSNNPMDLQNAKTLLVWGANPTDGMRYLWPWVCKARDNGAKIITIDPQYTKCAAQSDAWFPIRGGTDGALMLAMCNYIIENDLIDYDYLKNKSVAPLLVKEDGSYLRLSEAGLDLLEGEPGADGKPSLSDTEVVWDEETGAFVSSHVAASPAVSGSYEVNGIKVRTAFDLTRESIAPFTVDYAAQECDLPKERIEWLAETYATNGPASIMNYWGFEHFTNSFHNYKNLMLLGSLTGNINKEGASVWQGSSSYNTSPAIVTDSSDTSLPDYVPGWQITGEYLPEIMRTGKWADEDLPIRCVWVMNANPLSSGLGRTEVAEAFRQVDFTVVADSFMTDTALNASLVLPIAMSWENEDHFGMNFMLQKGVAPAGECKTDMDVMRMVAAKLGFDDLYDKSDEEYMRDFLDTEQNLANGYGYDDFKAKGLFEEWSVPASLIGAEYNATGRSQFYAANMVPRDDYGQAIEMKDRLPFYEHATEAYPGNPLMEKYPLFAMSFHDNYHGHSLFNGVPWLDELRGEPYVKIHTQAAEERGIGNGDLVRVFNDRGFVVLKAFVTEGIRPDTVLLPHGFESPDYVAGHPQSLTGLFLDPMTSNNNYNDMLVEVELYEEGDR